MNKIIILFCCLGILSACERTPNKYDETKIDLTNVSIEPDDQFSIYTKWHEILEYYDPAQIEYTYYAESKLQLLNTVNTVINSVPYVVDKANYGQPDYWAMPDRFFELGGDCEDYVIAKYFTLKKSGFPQDDMRLTIVYDITKKTYHAVLLATVDNVVYVLDNQNDKVLPSSQVSRYASQYQINETAVWR